MNDQKLVHMVNQIAQFFEAMPDQEQALADIAEHVRKFWDPRMRRQMLAYLDTCQGQGLNATALAALTRHRAQLE